MFKRRLRLPSPALVISMVALALVLGGTAVAATTATHKDKKADTKLIKKMAPSLSVKHAKTANSATTAASATHAATADTATNATNAANATNATTAANATQLGGNAASYYAHAGHEAVHLVGTTGQPAFQNSWHNFGSAWSSAGFWKDAFGVVHLQGTITAGTGGSPAFTLPTGYRPSQDLFMTVANGTGSAAAYVYIYTTGEVVPNVTGDIGFDGLSFLSGAYTAAARHHTGGRTPGH